MLVTLKESKHGAFGILLLRSLLSALMQSLMKDAFLATLLLLLTLLAPLLLLNLLLTLIMKWCFIKGEKRTIILMKHQFLNWEA